MRRYPPLKRILMIEDEPDIQAVAQLALEALGGFQVRVCSTGNEGIQAAAAFAPDLILLDVMMPGQWMALARCVRCGRCRRLPPRRWFL